MLVKEWMTKEVATIAEDAPLIEAIHLMKEKRIRRLPVMSGTKLVGIITDVDVQTHAPSEATSLDIHEVHYLLAKTRVKEVMTKNPVTLKPDNSIEKAAVVMLDSGFGGLPVVDPTGDLVGIISQRDCLNSMVTILGFRKKGTRIAVEVKDEPSILHEIAHVIEDMNLKIHSLVTCELQDKGGMREVVFRVEGHDVEAVVKELKVKYGPVSVIK